MKTLARCTLTRLLALLVMFAPGFAPGSAVAQDQPGFSQQQLDQMLAPIALYPDPLLSQMLMASTYPLEVVEAARWSKAHPGLQGDEAVQSVTQGAWDPSVKSLVAFPQVLAWMDENLEWTRTLGDAFLAQEPQVMETVQNLRQRAQAAGTLRSDERIRVVEEERTISVVPADPQLVYVPYYDPLLAYGTWWWPAYPPVHWRPWPGYFIRPGYATGFYWSPGITISTGFFFGAFDWPRRHVRVVHVNNYYYYTVTVNRQAYPQSYIGSVNRPQSVANPQANVIRAPGVWRHDSAHRRGIAYRDAAAQRQFGAVRVEPQRHEPVRIAPPDRRGGSMRTPDPRRSDAPTAVPSTNTGAGLTAPQAGEPRPESRLARPDWRRDATPRSEAPRTGEPRPESRLGRPEWRRGATPRSEAPRAGEPRPEGGPARPEVRRFPATPPQVPQAREPRLETRPAQQEVRREATPRFEPPRSLAQPPEARGGRESKGPAGANAEARASGNREARKVPEQGERSGGKERRH